MEGAEAQSTEAGLDCLDASDEITVELAALQRAAVAETSP